MPDKDSVPATHVGAGPSNWPLLLSPREIRGRRIRNRIVSTPHATGWGQGGLIAPAEVAYHVRKAAGGCGLIMTFGSASVDPDSAASYGSVSLWDPRNDDALRALADGVHAHGGVCMSQLTHMGRRGSSLESGIPLRGSPIFPKGCIGRFRPCSRPGKSACSSAGSPKPRAGCTASAGMASR
jgi:dimethylglycine catabolism A